jgi:phosphate transport system substrate-binding protein
MSLGSLPHIQRPSEVWLSIGALILIVALAVFGYLAVEHTTSTQFIPPPSGGIVRINGSDTALQLVTALAEGYSKQYPGTTFNISGDGSNVGIQQLLNKELEIADASRSMTADEMSTATQNGMHVQTFVLAQDAVAVIVHKDNPVTRLTLAQLAGIYTGTTTNWKDVGGMDAPITLYGRESTSGTFSFVRDVVLHGASYATSTHELSDTQKIVDAVIADPNAIGYVGRGYITDFNGNPRPDIQIVSLSGNGRTYYSPLLAQTVYSRDYPLARSLYQYMPLVPAHGSAVEGLLRFEMSDEGKTIIQRSGFFVNATDTAEQNQMLIDSIR